MCYAGGPYCYKDTQKVYENTKKRFKDNPIEKNREKLIEITRRRDSTPEGQQELQARIAQSPDVMEQEYLDKRLKEAQAERARQIKQRDEKKAAKKAEKDNRFVPGYSAEAHQAFNDNGGECAGFNVDKHEVSTWAAVHDKDGNYIYQGPEKVDDLVSVDGTLYVREGATLGQEGRRPLLASSPYSFRIQADKELTQEEADQLSNLTKYAYASTGGEKSHYEETIQDSPNSVIVHLDTTKNRAYRRLDKFMDNLHAYAKEGTPTRKKDGEKALQGLDGIKNVHIYSDDASGI